MKEILKVMTCGSVDDGKSTLLGRILFETNNIFQDQSEYLDSIKSNNDDEIDYSLLLDGLIDEKSQGITIDLAFKYLNYKDKNIVFIDSPGHEEFTKNTAYAATLADVAVILVDSTKGVLSQTKNHMSIVSLFQQIKTVIFAINKLDLVDNATETYSQLSKELNEYCSNLSISNFQVIPVSALNGDNVLKKSTIVKTYKGNSLLNSILSINQDNSGKHPTLLPVEFVDRDKENNRVVFVSKYGNNFKVGDSFVNFSSNEKIVIKNIFSGFESVKVTKKEDKNLAITFDSEVSIQNTDILVEDVNTILKSDTLNTTLVWASKSEQIKSKRYIFKFHNQQATGFFSKNKSEIEHSSIIFNSTIELEEYILVTKYSEFPKLAEFIVIDIDSNETVGFGYVNFSLDRSTSIKPKKLKHFTNDNAKCLWFTGLSGSGKTTLAENLAVELSNLSMKYYILDGDNLRKTINKDLGFSVSDRYENNRRIAHVAKILSDSGVMPIVTTISPYHSLRLQARNLFDADKFSLVYVKASLDTCIARNPKNIYSETKKIKNVTGIDMDYEIPKDADIIVDTEQDSIQICVSKIIDSLEKT